MPRCVQDQMPRSTAADLVLPSQSAAARPCALTFRELETGFGIVRFDCMVALRMRPRRQTQAAIRVEFPPHPELIPQRVKNRFLDP